MADLIEICGDHAADAIAGVQLEDEATLNVGTDKMSALYAILASHY